MNIDDLGQGRLRESRPDIFFLRWSEGAYQHYATVRYGTQSSWRCPEAVCAAAERLIQELPTVQALLDGDLDLARSLLLTLLIDAVDVSDDEPLISSPGRP